VLNVVAVWTANKTAAGCERAKQTRQYCMRTFPNSTLPPSRPATDAETWLQRVPAKGALLCITNTLGRVHNQPPGASNTPTREQTTPNKQGSKAGG
jgi:hypothetical protein